MVEPDGFEEFPARAWMEIDHHPEWKEAVEEYEAARRVLIPAELGFCAAVNIPPADLASDDLGKFTLTPIQEWLVRRGSGRWEPRAEGKWPEGIKAIRMPDGKYHLGVDLVDGVSSRAVDERAALEELKGELVRQKSAGDDTIAFFEKLASKAKQKEVEA